MMNQLKNCIALDLAVLSTDCFSKAYPLMNNLMLNKRGDNVLVQESRNGDTVEILDFKTIINNPYRRCVGGNKRNVNIFFLLAEAIWIFEGKRDVKFLDIFNSNMKNFSDDGVNFHAPYGFRMRHWGVESESKFTVENLHASYGLDQIQDSVKLLSKSPDTRQAVISIWNPDFDLARESKDIPCNDMVMMKIRGGKLYTTIQNRSNDLHWGLTTNIFQFSFMSELISLCIGVELARQVHNSQSLHIYGWNETAKIMDESFMGDDKNNINGDLYDHSSERRIDVNFSHDVPTNRLKELDFFLNNIINNIQKLYDEGSVVDEQFFDDLLKFSSYFASVYTTLKIYVNYKLKKVSKEEALELLTDPSTNDWDINLLARNFFASRIDGYHNEECEILGKL